MKEIAKKYISMGLSVIPINRETKIPAVDWKEFQTRFATSEELEIFSDGSLDMGIVTGPISGIFVLDLDLQHAEAEVFKKEHPMPRTWYEQTKNGFHYYFKYTAELAAKKTLTRAILAPGVDSRGDKGIVKCAPSQGYKWIVSPFHAPLAPPPQWLIDLLPEKEGSAVAPASSVTEESFIIQALEQIIPKDSIKGRNPVFLSVIGTLKKKGLLAPEVKAFLKPWGERYDYSAKLDKLVDDQFTRYPAPEQKIDADSGSLVEFMKDVKPVQWIVQDVIAESSINIIAGLGESRKTWIVNDLALAAATGSFWLGRFPVKKQKVLMLNQERPRVEVQRRFGALMKARGIAASDLEGMLLLRSNTSIRINLQHSFEAFHKYLTQHNPQLILVDSFNTFHTLAEENRGDMQFAFEKIKQLRDEFGCSFMLIDHENKMAFQNNLQDGEVMLSHDKVAGSVVKSEVAEGVLVVRQAEQDASMIYHTKNTFGSKIDPVLVKVNNLTEDKSSIEVKAY